MGGSLEFEEIKNMNEKNGLETHKNIDVFVETGTYMARTTLMASNHYKQVYTTEIHHGLYIEARIKAAEHGILNIKFIHGDSIEKLPTIIPNCINGAVFFLDAHISGSDSGWNGTDRVPLMEELSIILTSKPKDSLFILDDLRFWKGHDMALNAFDWDHISVESVLDIFTKHNVSIHAYEEFNDRFWIWTT